MSITNKIKNYLLRTFLGKTIRNLQSFVSYVRIPQLRSKIDRKTVYCISPYKTGTTYLSNCFRQEISKHEPLHHLSLKALEINFNSFFARRMKHLNLKLECSGMWSAYIKELVENEISRDLEYICVLRPPSAWVSSVINHWHKTMAIYKYEFTNELFWKKKVDVDLYEFQIGVDTKKNQEIINKLIRFYMDFTKNTRLLNNVTYIKLKEIDNNLSIIESLINENSTDEQTRSKWKGKDKSFVYKNQSIDSEYEHLTTKLINERKSLS